MGSLFRMSEALNLHFTTYGDASRPTLIILHGLLGSSDNWHSIARRLSDHFHVCTIDARNHGRSPHSEEFDYPVMVNDVVNFMYRQKRATASLLGHSMGGKTAAWMALLHPELIEKLIVVDIAVRSYQAHHDRIFDALTTLNLRILQSRKEVDQALSDRIPEPHVRQFLLKNLLTRRVSVENESGCDRKKIPLHFRSGAEWQSLHETNAIYPRGEFRLYSDGRPAIDSTGFPVSGIGDNSRCRSLGPC